MQDDYLAPASPFADFNRRTFLGIVLIGALSALITVVVGGLLNQFVVAPALCGSAAEAVCNNSTSVSYHISSLIAAVAAVPLLVNLSVYRPLLVVIAMMIGSWGLYNLPFPLINSPWYWKIGLIFFANGLALLVFSWLLRSYNFVFAIVLSLLVCAAMVLAISL